MDAGPLIKLALVDQLDLLLAFDTRIYIPDEVLFEAAEKFAWEQGTKPSKDKVRLLKWVKTQEAKGTLAIPATLVGEAAKAKRDRGEFTPKNHKRHTGELAAHEFFNHREEWGHPGEPAVLLMDDGPQIDNVRVQNLDVHILSTFGLLLALQGAKLIASAESIWSLISAAIPTAPKLQHDESVRGDTEYRSAIRKRP
jgi:hypothetical protein